MHRVDVAGETIRLSISLRLAVEFFLRVTYKRDTQILLFNFIFDLCGQAGVPQ